MNKKILDFKLGGLNMQKRVQSSGQNITNLNKLVGAHLNQRK